MNYLSVNSISKSYGIKTLFADVTFGIEKGDKTALIATNGSGKSTMLKILVGQESPDSGTITYANDIKIGRGRLPTPMTSKSAIWSNCPYIPLGRGFPTCWPTSTRNSILRRGNI